MYSRSLRSTLTISLVAATLGVLCNGVSGAQTVGNSGMAHASTALHMVKGFESRTGATVVFPSFVDLNTTVTVPAQGFATRGQELSAIASALNLQWRKVYVVVGARAGHPVVRLSDAKYFTDGQGKVSFDAAGLPVSSAIAAVAQADGAVAFISTTVPVQSVTLHTDNMSVPDAITTISAQSHTNWKLAYQFAPVQIAVVQHTTGDEVVVPRRMGPEHQKLPTDATTRIPGYYAPFTVHAPANPVTNAPNAIVASPPASGGANIPGMPSVVSPVGSGIVSQGYGYASPAFSPYLYNPYVYSP